MGASSWLAAVKKTLSKSPTKDSNSTRFKVEHSADGVKRVKFFASNLWIFRKKGNPIHQNRTVTMEHNHAIAVEETGLAAAKAAVEIIRRRYPADSSSFKLHYAAKLIQTAFRGYLARKALLALKGIVKFQALIRGQNVRRQAAKAMKCMQSLLRVQSMVREHLNRLSHDGARRSMLAETCNFWDYSNNLTHRNAVSKNCDQSINFPRSLQEIEATLKSRIKSASKPIKMEEECCRSRCPSPVHWRSVVTSREQTPRRSIANTPCFQSTPRISNCIAGSENGVPNYMAPTESAKARIRSQSVPRQRDSTPEIERNCSARRRLTYQVQLPEPVGKLRSTASFKGFRGVEEENSIYSCYAKSRGETSHSSCSTTELRSRGMGF